MTSPESDQQETKDNKASATTEDVTEPLFKLAARSRTDTDLEGSALGSRVRQCLSYPQAPFGLPGNPGHR
jgi:hypothetical protein